MDPHDTSGPVSRLPRMEPGWFEDPETPPHVFLRGPIDRTRDATVVPVEGRPVLVVPAGDDGAGLVRAVDLDTGTVLPDRSGLRRAGHDALALGAGRLLATMGQPAETMVVRDAVTGAPVGVPLQAHPRGLALATLDGRAVMIWTGGGLTVREVRTGALVARHERLHGRLLMEYQGRHLLLAEESATSLRPRDVLTGEAYGPPLPCDFSGAVFRSAAVEHDGRLLIAFLDGHTDGRVSLWDATTGAELPTAPPFDDVREIDAAVVDGRPLLLAGRSGRAASPLMLWDLITGQPAFPGCFDGYDGECSRVALGSLDEGFSAVVVDRGGSSALWVGSSAGTRRTALADGGMSRVALGAIDGRPTVALGGGAGQLRLFDVRTGREFSSPFYGGPVDESIVGATDNAGRAVVLLRGSPPRLWDVAAGVPVARLDRFGDRITGVAAGELGGRTVFALVDGDRGTATTLSVCDLDAGELVAEVSLDRSTAEFRTENVVFTEIAGRTAVAMAIDRTVHSWDAATGEPRGRPYRGLPRAVSTMAAGRIGDRPVIAVGGKDGAVHVFDPATGAAVVPPMAGHSQSLTALAFGAVDGRTVVASGSWDKSVRVWDAATSEPRAELHTGADVAVRRTDLGVLDGRLVALTIGYDRSGDSDSPALALWDVSTGEPLYEPMAVPEECEVGTLAMLDGRLAVVQGIDAFSGGEEYHPEDAADVQVIDVATRTVLRRHRSQRGWSYHATVCRSAKGAVVLVTAEDWVVAVNPYETGGPDVEEFQYTGHREFVNCVATAEVAGRTIVASGDRGNALHFWDLDTRERLR